MLPCYQLSPLLVLMTVSFHSFILADTQSADSISTHIDGALSSQQSPHQQQQQRQQLADVPSPIASSYRASLFQSDDSNALPFPYDVSSDSLEGDSAKAKSGPSLVPRGSPRFVGKKDRTDASELEDFDDHERPSRALSPRFVGKKRVNEEVSSGILTDDHRVEKRSAPRFVGKRNTQNRASPYLSAQEFKNTFRRTDPLFIGKRTPYFDEDDFNSKRGAPRFVGKRKAPKFVGKRGAPRFVGKRGAPRFVGKRGAPRFVGKRDQYELAELLDPRAVLLDPRAVFLDDGVDEETPSGQRDDPSDESLLASEVLNAERQGLVGFEGETAEEGEDRR